jgi:hypothetical protein
VVAQLVPLQASSLALVGSLLITTLPSSGNAANLGTTETEATSAVAAAVAPAAGTSAASLGQGALPQGASNGAAEGGDQEPDNQQAAPAPAAQAPPGAAPWQRFVLGTDEALERYDREHPGPPSQERHDAPETDPAGGQDDIQVPAPQEPPPAQGSSTREGRGLEAIDGAIERWHDPVPVSVEYIRRVGETHRVFDHMRLKSVGFTHPTEPHEERFDISAALALAATVAGAFYFPSANPRAKARPCWARGRGIWRLRTETWASDRGDSDASDRGTK